MKNFDKLIDENKDYALEVLSKLISFESVLDKYVENGNAPFGIENKKALEYILSVGKSDGFDVKNVDNYAGHIEFGQGDDILGVLAHLDVVPVNKEEWDSYPFTLSIRGDKMYARGALDDKGPLVASYIAMKILKDSGFKPNKKVRLIMGCDEESGSRCLERYLEKEQKPTLGFSPDAEFPLIYGEKGMASYDIIGNLKDDVIIDFECGERYNIVPSKAMVKLNINLEKEYLEYLSKENKKGEVKDGYLVAYGIASHAMCPQNGVNAAYILFDFLSKYSDSKLAKFVSEYFLDDVYGKKMGYYVYDEDMKELTSNLAVVHQKDGTFKLGVNCRVPLDSQFAIIEECVKKACQKYGYEYKILSTSPRHYVSKDDELVKTLLECYQTVSGDYKTEPFTIGGGTYAREIGKAVAFGPLLPGREDVCHIANEYMYLSDFFNSIKIYMQAIYKLCK